MIRSIINFIKTKPMLYDLANSMRPIRSETQRWLLNFSRRSEKPITFLQIGANDGLRWDPLRRFIVSGRWTGVLVEPLTPVFEMLQQNYKYLENTGLVFLNAAVSSQSRNNLRLWSISDDFGKSLSLEEKLYFLRKSSTNRDHVARSLIESGVDESNVNQLLALHDVPCMSVSKIIEKYCPSESVDLVFIDAEGHDDEIVRSIDMNLLRPKAILYESHNLHERQKPLEIYLRNHGYTVSLLKGDSVAELTTN